MNTIHTALLVLASPHSGAGFLGRVLDRHPELYAPLPLNLLVEERVRDLADSLPPAALDGTVRSIAQLYAGEQSVETVAMARRWLFRRVERDTLSVLGEICSRVAPRRLVEIGVLYADPHRKGTFERLDKAPYRFLIIHLVRHPIPQGLCWLRQPEAVPELYRIGSIDTRGGTRQIDPQIDWLRRNSRIREYLRQVPRERQFRLRIEDLLGHPEPVLPALCDWLQLEWSEAIRAQMQHPERSAFSGPGPYGAEGGLDSEFLAPAADDGLPDMPARLDRPLPWRTDHASLRPELLELAGELGYGIHDQTST